VVSSIAADVEILACDPARDGALIRDLTRANFYEAMRAIWDEARHQREPVHPERYRMLRRGGEMIGFFAVRYERDHVYVETIQLIPSARRCGLGTYVMGHVALLAGDAKLGAVRLRVLRANHDARRLYVRLGYRAIGGDETSELFELALDNP
jgi:ribosomal protein S18 acetylase RimI-like enzyme